MSSPAPPIKSTWLIAVAMAGLLCLSSQSALAATYTWTGLGSGNNWRIGSNWSAVTSFPQVGDDIVFAGSVRPNPNNNNSAVQGVFSSITFDSTATNFLITGVAALTFSNGITNNSVNTQTFNNPITLGSSNVTVAASSGNITMRQAVGDAGAGRGMTKTGSATLTLSNNNTYTGATTISDGAVVLSAGGSLSTNSALDLAGATARFDIAGLTASGSTNASLAGVAGSVVNLGSKNLNVGGNNTSTTFAGTITNTGSLTKSGTGTLTLSGNNTYTGGTTISAGTLLFTNGGSVAGNITNNATLSINRTDTATLSNTVSGTGAMTKTGAGTLTLTGTNTYTGATTVAGGTLRIDGNSRLGNTTNTLTISNAGVLDVTAAGTLTNAVTIGAGNGVLLNSSSGALVVAGNVSKDGTVFTSRAGSGTNIFTGVISGASANSDFVVDGGTTVFSNVMTYNGPTIVLNGGTLNLGTNNAIPTGSALRLGTNATAGTVNLQGNNQTVASLETQGTAGTNNLVTLGGGTLTIDGGGSTTYAGAISGNGTVQKSSAGTMTLSGSVTVTNLRISAGAVALGADNVLGDTLNLDLNGGTFIVGSSGTRYTDTLGTLTLSANSTIDMGATGGLGTITFANSSGISWATNAVLTISNWQGVASQQSEVTKLLFGTGGLDSTQLAQIRFADQNIDGGQLLGAQGELAPIPEAPVVWGAAALAAFIVLRERRRFLLLGRLSASLALPALGPRQPCSPAQPRACLGVGHAQPGHSRGRIAPPPPHQEST